MTHQPKGGMCMTCAHLHSDCSGLKFHQMPVVKTYPDGTKAVRCTFHSRTAPRTNRLGRYFWLAALATYGSGATVWAATGSAVTASLWLLAASLLLGFMSQFADAEAAR